MIGADRPHDVDGPGVGYPGHLGAECLGDLDGEGADATARPIDENALTGLEPALVAKALEGGLSRDRTAAACSRLSLSGIGTTFCRR